MDNKKFNNICKIYELKGRQELYSSSYFKILDRMAKSAKIESTKALFDNILNYRLKDLIERTCKPLNSNEKEIKAYHKIFDKIVNDYDKIPFNEKTLIKMHYTIFNKKDISVKNMDEIFILYKESIKDFENPLIYIPKILFKFIKLKAFEDGNNRIARLIILLLLFKNGFSIGKYVSISYLIKENIDEYNKAISKDDDNDFVIYFLDLILQAYTLINNRFLDITNENISTTEKILRHFVKEIRPISKSEIMRIYPDISQRTIERTLKNLLDDFKIIRIGNGKNTKYMLKEGDVDEEKY